MSNAALTAPMAAGVADAEKMNGKFLNYPAREEIPENINEQLIVELYSK